MFSDTNMKVLSQILHGIYCSYDCKSPANHTPYTHTQKMNVKGFLRYDPRLGLAWIGLLWAALFYLWMPPDKWRYGSGVRAKSVSKNALTLDIFVPRTLEALDSSKNNLLSCRSLLT